MKHYPAIVIGTGMGALTSACLLAKNNIETLILEQNYLPGGCTSSYWRKGFVFESGATTLVGLDEGMPLGYLLKELDIKINPVHLKLPMQVHLRNGAIINRYQDLEEWIAEAERVFGKKNQAEFWYFAFKLSQFVWKTSIKQTAFPPSKFSDLWQSVKKSNLEQIRYARYAFYSTQWLLKKFDLLENKDFVEFVNEQLLITAQNYLSEVNTLFGAAALCYTNYNNYYMQGGLINLINPLLEFLEKQQGKIQYREGVEHIELQDKKYIVQTKKGTYSCDFLISGIPINNTVQIYEGKHNKKYQKKILNSPDLNSAFQMGIGFKKNEFIEKIPSIHHQIHLKEPLQDVGSHSIFISLNHPSDTSRTDEADQMVASVSTHLSNPKHNIISDKQTIEEEIIKILNAKKFLQKEDIIYKHSSSQKSWEKWTGRSLGFVGGYPQFMKIKPWQMIEARLDHKKAYICGDTAYPGQGIPGTVLSGIIAFEKLKRDWL